MQSRHKNYMISDFVISVLILIMILFIFFAGQAVGIHKEASNKIVEKEIIYIYIIERKIVTEKEETPKEETPKEETPTRGGAREFTITAYDNSVESQGKWVDQTATGFNLKGHSLETAKCIAVDPKVIPLGSKVELIFDDSYKHLNGVYIALDTGGAIKGNKIDLFMGDDVDKKIVTSFGRRKVKVRIIDE